MFEPAIFDYLPGDDTTLEDVPLHALAEEGQIAAFQHSGFWQPMDTYRESQLLQRDVEQWRRSLEVVGVTDLT